MKPGDIAVKLINGKPMEGIVEDVLEEDNRYTAIVKTKDGDVFTIVRPVGKKQSLLCSEGKLGTKVPRN